MIIKSISEIKKEILANSPTPAKVKILAVSKKQAPEKIKNLFLQGQQNFGENYVQEALIKMKSLDLPLKWHFIGHLQSNKVKDVVGNFSLIHSVDSLKLAKLINSRAQSLKKTQQILLEINIACEKSKSGFLIEDLESCWSEMLSLSHIAVCGMMCLPPAGEDEVKTSHYFKNLAEFLKVMKSKAPNPHHSLDELSMGTSGDYLLALKQGATIIRLGTILFGERS